MSQIETNPLQNPTTQLSLPKQIMNVKPSLGLINFLEGLTIHDKSNEINYDQMDWTKIAAKNKFIAAPQWSISSPINWYTQEINPKFIFNFVQVARTVQTFFQYDILLMSIQPTFNPYFQGLVKFAFDPAPTPDYYSEILGIKMDDALFTQFMTFDVTPKSRDRKDMAIPMLTPFAYIARQPLGLDNGNVDAELYLYNYPMGRILNRVFSPLVTKSTNTSMQMHISAQVMNLKTEGMNYGPPNTSPIG